METLRKLLELRFGKLAGPALKRLETADGAALDRYTERVISAATLDEVFER